MRLLSLINIFVLNFVLAKADQVSRLTLNCKCSIYQDMISIEHDFDHNLLRIKMKDIRKCKSPSFMVRLSGSSLQLLENVHQNHSLITLGSEARQDSLFTYRYEPVDQGVYFIEVLVQFCTSVDPDVHFSACMEDVQNGDNVLNTTYSFNVTGPTQTQKYPRWVLNNHTTPAYLPTRYQKNDPTCATMNTPFGAFCPTANEDVRVHRQYDWTNVPTYYDMLRQMAPSVNKSSTQDQPYIRVCLIGSSHAREIGNAGTRLLIDGIQFLNIWVKFPAEFNVDVIATHACSYAVVTCGQWPFGYLQPNLAYTLSNYETEMRRILAHITTRTTALDTPVFMMSLNYNGLGWRYTSCSPVDHRSPLMIDLANGAVRQLSAEYSIPFIDLKHIIGPLWDSQVDWDHPYGKVFTAEAEWVLHALVDYSVTHHQPPPVRYGPLVKRFTVRFTDSKTVYLCQENVMRAFPDGHTFMAMGFDFGDVVVMTEYNRPYYVFESDLPRH